MTRVLRQYWKLFVLVGIALILLGYHPHSPADLQFARSWPGVHYWLGGDTLGRSLGVQMFLGVRTSLTLSFLAVFINLFNGLWVGFLAGGGRTAVPMSRLIDLGLAVPSLLFALLLVAMLGASFRNLLLAFIVLGWTGFARVVRGEVRRLYEEEYVLAARATGVPGWRIAVLHMLPQLVPILLVQSTFALGAVILGESTLSFLGLGDPSLPSLGKQLSDGVDYLRSAPHLTLLPGSLLAALILLANITGDRLQDRFTRRR